MLENNVSSFHLLGIDHSNLPPGWAKSDSDGGFTGKMMLPLIVVFYPNMLEFCNKNLYYQENPSCLPCESYFLGLSFSTCKLENVSWS